MKIATSGIMSRRIPTLLGVAILVAGLVAGVVLVNMRQGIESKAGPSESPKNLKISNLGSTTFSVSWTTDIPLTGLIKYSEDPAKITIPAGDIRDQISGTSQNYNVHSVNVSGLSANRTYYFLITSGSGSYDDNGRPFQVRTQAQVVAPPEDIVFGKVVKENGDPISGGVVFVEVEGGMTLSTITKADGTWRLNLANSRDKDGKVLTYDQEKSPISIFVRAGSLGTATAITDTGKDKPVPDIVIGKNQVFTELGQLLPPTNEATESTEIDDGARGFQLQASTLDMSEQMEATSSVKILNPATNGEVIATDRPEFRGKAPVGKAVKLTVFSVEMTQTVMPNADGDWNWTPPQKLDPGQHTLTAEYTDGAGATQKITRTFVVLLANLPAFTSTPSATPTDIALTGTPPTVMVTMPATGSGSLTNAGGLMSTMGLAILGLLMLVGGVATKKLTGEK